MPKNHRHVDTEQKKQAIVAVATRLFIKRGFQATSMSLIADESQVAANTIYWYFPNKDALLIAVLNGLLTKGYERWQTLESDQSLVDQVMMAIEDFESCGDLMQVVHARVNESAELARWHQQFHHVLELGIEEKLVRYGVAEDKLSPASKLLVYVIEGLIAHPHKPSEREMMLRFYLDELVSEQ